MSEDCLYLDVYTPASGTKGKAVMFWIYVRAALSHFRPLYIIALWELVMSAKLFYH